MPVVNLDWFTEGIEYASKNRDIIVIVDAFRFSSAVVTAIANGFTIYPVCDRKRGEKLARKLGAEMSGRTGVAKYSLSPLSFLNPVDNNPKVVLFSPNGAACCESIKESDTAFIGCFLNAKAVAEKTTAVAKKFNRNVSIIAAGEQRAIDDGKRVVYTKEPSQKVFALEDYLACGAIISYSNLAKTSEAELCQLAYQASQHKLKELLIESFSGKYLVQNNRSKDVEHAMKINLYGIVPVIRNGKIGL